MSGSCRKPLIRPAITSCTNRTDNPQLYYRRRLGLDASSIAIAKRPSCISVGSTTGISPIPSSMNMAMRSRTPTEQKSDIFAKDAAMHSKSCLITAIGRSPPKMPTGPCACGCDTGTVRSGSVEIVRTNTRPGPRRSLFQLPRTVRNSDSPTVPTGLMFHHFAELGGPTLVRSTNFDYRNADPAPSCLSSPLSPSPAIERMQRVPINRLPCPQ